MQAEPDAVLQKMFGPKTGFLPLAVVGHADCFDDFLPAGALPQLYSMFANQLCPPEGFTAAFNGEFVVSRERIRRNEWWTYQHLLVSICWIFNIAVTVGKADTPAVCRIL